MGRMKRFVSRTLSDSITTATQWLGGAGPNTPPDIAPHPRVRFVYPTQTVECAAFTSDGIGFGGKGSVLYRTRDFFRTMEPVDRLPSGETCYLVFVDSRDYVYWNAMGSGRLRRSTDGGNTWTTVLHLGANPDRGFWRMCEQPTTGYLFASEYTSKHAISCRVHRSRDWGETWEEVLYVPGERHVHAVHSTDEGTVYAATGDSLSILYRSTDNGDSWRIVRAGRNLTAIASYGSTLLLGSDAGWSSDVWKSRDGGVTWESRLHLKPRRNIVWIRHFGYGVFLASHSLDVNPPQGLLPELLLSEDYGDTWTPVYRWNTTADWAGSWRESNVYQGWLHLSDEYGFNMMVTAVGAPSSHLNPLPDGAMPGVRHPESITVRNKVREEA